MNNLESHYEGCELNINYPVTGHKTDDRFTNAINNIQKFIDYLCTYLFILYVSNIFAANAVKSTTDSIWTNLSNKSISNMLAEVSE